LLGEGDDVRIGEVGELEMGEHWRRKPTRFVTLSEAKGRLSAPRTLPFAQFTQSEAKGSGRQAKGSG
jgi:hypothetical protein